MSNNKEQRLLDLYKNTMEEYRFQVRLNWDRMRFLLSLNIVVFTAAVGVLRIRSSGDYLFLVGLIFFIGIALAVFGQFITRRGREYYREIMLQKTRIERALMIHETEGLDNKIHDLSLRTTEGMRRRTKTLNDVDNEPAKIIRRGTVVFYFYHGFTLLLILHAIGLLLVVNEAELLITCQRWFLELFDR